MFNTKNIKIHRIHCIHTQKHLMKVLAREMRWDEHLMSLPSCRGEWGGEMLRTGALTDWLTDSVPPSLYKSENPSPPAPCDLVTVSVACATTSTITTARLEPSDHGLNVVVNERLKWLFGSEISCRYTVCPVSKYTTSSYDCAAKC